MKTKSRVPSLLFCIGLCSAATAQWQPRYTIDVGTSGVPIVVKRIGSINGDAIPDLVIGLPASGTVLLCSGRNGNELSRITFSSGGSAYSIAIVPSVDTDPNDEILIGDPSSGIVSLWSPRANNTNVLLAAWGPFSAPSGNSGYGAGVAARDLDGDGRPELLIGAHGVNNLAGMVEVLRLPAGSTTPQYIRTLNGQPGDMFGLSVTTIGDQNGDGVAEVVVGMPRSFGMVPPVAPGSVQIFSGALLVSPTPTVIPMVTLNGTVNNDQFGWTTAGVGDQDADGREDLAIGAPNDLDIANSSMRLYKFTPGPFGALQPQLLYDQPGSATEAVGRGIAACEDYDGNGVEDFLVGVTRDAPHQGYVSILNTVRSIWMPSGSGHTRYFGESVESLGTVLGRRLAVVADRGNGTVYVF